MSVPSSYRLSFTTGGLLSAESTTVAEIYLQHQQWKQTREQVLADNVLQSRTRAAAVRVSKEVVGRLETLTLEELRLVARGSLRERGYLLWMAVCRRYALVREFATEVLREHYLTLRLMVVPADFDAFFNFKAQWHEEMDRLADSTRHKLRQNLFRMLREAELLSAENLIQPAMLTPRLAELLAMQGEQAFQIFPLGDKDIQGSMQ